MLFFYSNSELVRLLSDFKSWSIILYFVFNSFCKWSICLLCLTDDVRTSSSNLDLKIVNSLSNISLMLLCRFFTMFSLKLSLSISMGFFVGVTRLIDTSGMLFVLGVSEYFKGV